ncbi:MobF family relaxase [Bifidobacterium crudilactis]|jgi:conjugative relaxase-like TrwC/TraI family protein|uniref:MobF family relaxase n=1 Tax=Bifidobacterium crudilactis TaxID=327277 RepID=UPI002351F8A6|nr:MobF family relaxase [Bifidobacterium crudilactis]MCI1218491.1 relaxase domain-containing protein [Bifidobacterium crudilactis]
MAMQFAKLMTGASDYFTRSVADELGDHQTGALADYYAAPRTPPGIWMGQGLALVGKQAGQRATGAEVSRLYDELRHPSSGIGLSRAGEQGIKEGGVVAGFDLTFTLPKSVSILWASGDEHIRAEIMRCHRQAIEETLTWAERRWVYTRTGAGGRMRQRVKGVTAVAFTHWDSREHDPHLHDHLLVSNLVTREDGRVGTLDGASLYPASVAISERHTNLLMGLLTQRLGVAWRSRRTSGGKAGVYDLTGIDDELIHVFSKRHQSIEQRKQRSLQQLDATAAAGSADRMLTRIDREAWRSTRHAKPAAAPSLHELMARWRTEERTYGYEPDQVAAGSVHIDHATTPVGRLEHEPRVMADLATLFDQRIASRLPEAQRLALSDLHERTIRGRTIIREPSIHAAADRLIRGALIDPQDVEHLVDTLVDVEKSRLVALTPARYQVPATALDDRELSTWNGRAATDLQTGGDVYATRELLAAEASFKRLADRECEPTSRLDSEQAAAVVTRLSSTGTHPSAGDQRDAAVRLLADRHMISALTGPAGTGKTTTLCTVVQAIDRLQGGHRILALAPTAVAAAELHRSLGVPAETMAKILYEQASGRLTRQLGHAKQEYAGLDPTREGRRDRLAERIVSLEARLARYAIPEHGTVIVDEAGMADTISLEHLARLCEQKHARMVLSGDDLQLGTPGEGAGALAWMVDQHRDVKLSSVWRFHDPAEADRARQLREGARDPDTGHYTVFDAYEQAGRLHADPRDHVEAELIDRYLDDLANDVDVLLIVGSNDELTELNDRISQDRQQRGQVDPDNRITLADGGSAGAGDLIITRHNDRTIPVTNTGSDGQDTGAFVRNNDLWIVQQVRPQGVVVRQRDGPGTAVLPRAYISEHVTGGYALTPHRSQGKTVERAYYYLPPGTLAASRSTTYVAMTRGRDANSIWVATTPINQMQISGHDGPELAAWKRRNQKWLEHEGRRPWMPDSQPPDHEHWYTPADLLPTPMQQARAVLDSLMSEDRQIMASEWARRYERSVYNLANLDLEWHAYQRIMAERHLTHTINPQQAEAWKTQPGYNRLIDAYGDALLADQTRAQAIVQESAGKNTDADHTRIQLARISAGRARAGWLARAYQPTTLDESTPQHIRDAADLMNQTYRQLSQQLADQVNAAADRETPPVWVRRVGQAPPETSPRRQQWDRLIGQIIIYRETRQIDDPYTPLGPPPERPDAMRRRIIPQLKAWRHRERELQTPAKPASRVLGIQAGKARAIRAGRAVLLDGVDDLNMTGQDRYVRIRTDDVAASITKIRELQGGTITNLTIRVDNDQSRLDAWQALMPRERGAAMEISAIDDLGTQLWSTLAEQLGLADDRRTLRHLPEGLQGAEQTRAVVDIRDRWQEERDEIGELRYRVPEESPRVAPVNGGAKDSAVDLSGIEGDIV